MDRSKLPNNPWVYFAAAAIALAVLMYFAQSKTTGDK